MRNFPGSNPGAIDDPRIREVAVTHENQLRELSNAVSRLGRGETPDASGVAVPSGVTDHGALTGLGDDDHAQYALLVGRSGGQTIYGGNLTGYLSLRSALGATSYHADAILKLGDTAMLHIDPQTTVSGGTGISLLIDAKRTGLASARYIHCRDTAGTPRQDFLVADSISIFYNDILSVTRTPPLTAGVTIRPPTYQDIGLTVKGRDDTAIGGADQLNDLQHWQASNGTPLLIINKNGNFYDHLFALTDNLDDTKKLQFQVSGLSTATTRTLTAPDRDDTIATLGGAQTFDGTPYFTNSAFSGPALQVGVQPSAGSFDGVSGLVFYDESAGFSSQVFTSNLTADRYIEIPDGSGQLVLVLATQQLNNKALQAPCTLVATSASLGVSFTDSATSTKKLRMVLSGAVGNNSFTIANSAARDYKFINDSSTIIGAVAPTSATVDKTGQTASIGATTAYTTTHDGFYRMSAYGVFTAVTTPGALTFTAHYTDPQQAQTNAFVNAVAYAAAGSYVEGACVFYATSGTAIQYSTTITGTGTYNSYVRVESLS